MIGRIIHKIKGLSRPNQSLNIYKTIMINFILFGLKGIRVRPILIYNNTEIYNIGSIEFKCPLKRGLLTIGHLDVKSQGKTKFQNNGKIIIYNQVRIEGCCNILNKGTIIFHGFNRISDGCLVNIRDKFELGSNTDLGFQSVVMDTDDHFVIEIEEKRIPRNTAPIKIGANNFIGFRTIIKKGTITPDNLVVASANSLLTKDYTNLPPYPVIGGIPARLIKTGIRRIYDRPLEIELFKYFSEDHTIETKDIKDASIDDIDKYCTRDEHVF